MTRPDKAAAALPDCTGVLLAGGRATRLGGIDKATLRRDGEAIGARAVRLFAGMFAETLVVGGDAARRGWAPARHVPDLLPGRGAPGGLHAALAAARTPWIFLAACDMPFLAAEPIAALAALRGDAPAVAVVWRGRVEPLHAFWSTACLPAVARALAGGAPSMRALAEAVGARLVPEETWRAVDPGGRALVNVNTSEDVAAWGLGWPDDR